jgi:hypothetical protein
MSMPAALLRWGFNPVSRSADQYPQVGMGPVKFRFARDSPGRTGGCRASTFAANATTRPCGRFEAADNSVCRSVSVIAALGFAAVAVYTRRGPYAHAVSCPWPAYCNWKTDGICEWWYRYLERVACKSWLASRSQHGSQTKRMTY